VHPTSAEELANVGWPALTGPLPEGRPTAELLRIVGADATRNVVEVDEAGAAAFARGDALDIPPEASAEVLVVRRGHHALGGVSRETGRRWAP
jgi:NOL1/NOP2/fmu family ribosome biogenesis protein